MSLHTLANHLQSAGRGEDKVLIHMTPGEVHGLQSLAMAHGGSLTINPQTGLPEAGFLSSILPMLAGFALGPAGFALMSAPMAGLAVGAATGLATGSLKQGIMAGFGAYGGAGLGQGLMAQGASSMPPAAVNASQFPSTLGGTGSKVFANTADDLAGFAGKGTNPFSTNPAFQGIDRSIAGNFQAGMPAIAPPPVPSVVTNASAYSPTSNFNVGQNLSGNTAPRTMTIEPSPVLEAYGPLNRPPVSYTPPQQIADFSKFQTPSQYTGAPEAFIEKTRSNLSGPFTDRMSQLSAGMQNSASIDGLKGLYNAMPTGSVLASGATLMEAMKPKAATLKKDKSLIRPYDFDYNATGIASEPYSGSAERLHFDPRFTARTPYEAPGPEYSEFAMGGAVENMSAMNAIGANTGYPMAHLQSSMYSNPNMQRPEATNVIAPSVDAGVGAYTGEARFAEGGISNLGSYSDGGRLLRGPGDGVSDSIPASIGNRQPARLADGEFVVPARIVSEIGNGSTEAGARKLYAMMDRVQSARRKTVGKDQVAKNTKAEKLLPA